MSQRQISPPPSDCLPSVDELKQRLHDQLDTIIAACSSDSAPASFLEFERTLWKSLRLLGCLLIQLFLRRPRSTRPIDLDQDPRLSPGRPGG